MNHAHKPIIIGTGLITLDLILGSEPSKINWATGGTCGNVLSILALLNWTSIPIARLNGDVASKYVKRDLSRWGIDLRYATLEPTTDTPIIAQHRKVTKAGNIKHRFSWECPHCGAGLPFYKPVPISPIEQLIESSPTADIFYFDRPSPGALLLAKYFLKLGSLVYFEPSAKGDPKVLQQCINSCHILKYSEERFSTPPGSRNSKTENLFLEIQTLGKDGLRYKRFSGVRSGKWKTLSPEFAGVVKDTVGAGDWLSAGLICKVGNAPI